MKKIICIFPGTISLEGAKRMSEKGIVYIDPMYYTHHEDGTKNAEFPYNYVEAVKIAGMKEETRMVLCSSAPEVREELTKCELKYSNVYPYNNLRIEYVKKLRSFDVSKETLKYLNENWFQMLASMKDDKNALMKMRLNSKIELDFIFDF